MILQIPGSPIPGPLVATAPPALSDRPLSTDSDAKTVGPNSFVRWKILALLALASGVAYVLRQNMSVAGERMMSDLGLSQVQLGIVLGAFAWAYGIFQFPGGVFGDWLGARKGLSLIIAAWGVLNLLVALIPGTAGTSPVMIIALLAALRFLMGVAQAPLFPILSGHSIARWFPVGAWAFPNAVTNAGLTLGSAATGPLIAWLAHTLGWRASFATTAPLAFLMAAAWWWYSRDQPAQHAGVSARELAHINAGRPDFRAPANPRREWRLVLRDRNLLLITASYFAANYVFYFFFNWLYIYLVDVRKFQVLTGGLFASAPWICGAIGATLGGMICDRLARRHNMTISCRVVTICGLVLAGVFIVAAAGAASPYVALIFLCLCLAAQQFTNAASWAAATMVGGSRAAMTCGVMNTGGNVVGGLVAVVVPITAREFGWPVAVGSASLFAFVGAVLWLWIRVSPPTNEGRPPGP